ncbi:MAG: AraC family transcriptional regulator [Treponema sp.]|nr:AraC family transcriptional regulator [Treponema sp.]
MKNNSIKIEKDSPEFPVGVFSQKVYLSKPHHHIEYELFFLDEGNANFYIEETCHKLYPGDFVFLEPEIEHYVEKPSAGNEFHYFALVFDNSVFGEPSDSSRILFESIRIHRFPKISPDLSEKIKTYIARKRFNAWACDFFLKSLLYEIITYIIDTKQYEIITPLMLSQKHKVTAIDNAVLYIQDHYKENISFDDIQMTTEYSKSHFARLFKESVGINVTEYLNKFRIEKSCLDLIYTNKNITEIAMENGFNNIQYFSRVFKQFMNCTPKQYQKKAKDVIVPSAIPDSNK